jgi:tRNA (mo5U34)-methyltransferase
MLGTRGVAHSHDASAGKPSDLQQRADAITWFHAMDLGRGVRTKGVYDPARTLPRLKLPARLTGQRVLDVGAWDGFYSFEMERRGAEVVATDDYSWGGGGWGTKDGFDLAHRAFGSKVRAVQIDPLDLSPAAVGGRFDIVLLLGVLYHLRDPMVVLERVASVTAGLLVLETEVAMLLTKRPAAEFFPGTELNDDPTNWWAPNVPAMKGMLRAVGFRSVEVAWRRPLPLRAAKWAKHLKTPPRQTLRQALTTDRFVFHARR